MSEDNDEKLDVMMLGTVSSDDGAGVGLRYRNGRVRLVQFRAVREGEPIYGELAQLTERGDNSGLFDVNVLYASPEGDGREHGGPSMAATSGYRAGWARIFGDASDDEDDGSAAN